jgi:NADH:ubiquinone oxidoreductase subunit 4 (subunit M)
MIPALFSIMFTAEYHLWAMQRAMFGIYNEKLKHIHDGANFLSALAAEFILYPVVLPLLF